MLILAYIALFRNFLSTVCDLHMEIPFIVKYVCEKLHFLNLWMYVGQRGIWNTKLHKKLTFDTDYHIKIQNFQNDLLGWI